jgi:hypothetical protein
MPSTSSTLFCLSIFLCGVSVPLCLSWVSVPCGVSVPLPSPWVLFPCGVSVPLLSLWVLFPCGVSVPLLSSWVSVPFVSVGFQSPFISVGFSPLWGFSPPFVSSLLCLCGPLPLCLCSPPFTLDTFAQCIAAYNRTLPPLPSQCIQPPFESHPCSFPPLPPTLILLVSPPPLSLSRWPTRTRTQWLNGTDHHHSSHIACVPPPSHLSYISASAVLSFQLLTVCAEGEYSSSIPCHPLLFYSSI